MKRHEERQRRQTRVWERQECFQKASVEVKQPYDYAGSHMRWCVWLVLGSQRSAVVEATAAHQKQPEADLPVGAAAAAADQPLSVHRHTSLVQLQRPWEDAEELLLPVSMNQQQHMLSPSSACDSPSQGWRDLPHSSGRQGVEVGHVWSRMMPGHSCKKKKKTRNK